MTSLASKLASNAQAKIEKYGGSVDFASAGSSVYDPATSKNVPTGGQTQAGLKCLVEDMKGQLFKGNNPIIAGDKKLTIAALSIITPPKPGDVFTLPDGNYSAAPGDSVKTTWVANTPVFYEVQVRK